MKNTQTQKMTQLGRMFTYIALNELQGNPINSIFSDADWSEGAQKLLAKLIELGVVEDKLDDDGIFNHLLITYKGKDLINRYFKACSEELTKARFGKMKWDKRSKFHKELMARIA